MLKIIGGEVNGKFVFISDKHDKLFLSFIYLEMIYILKLYLFHNREIMVFLYILFQLKVIMLEDI